MKSGPLARLHGKFGNVQQSISKQGRLALRPHWFQRLVAVRMTAAAFMIDTITKFARVK